MDNKRKPGRPAKIKSSNVLPYDIHFKSEYDQPRFKNIQFKQITKMPIVIEPVNTKLNNIFLNETVKKELLEEIICSDKIYNLSNDNLLQQLTEYRDSFIDNSVSVQYKISDKTHGYGRVNPVKSLSVGSFKREVRHALCKDIYVDIDVVNMQPTLLYCICKEHNIPCEFLELYINNRELFFDSVANTYHKSNGTPLNVKDTSGNYIYKDVIKQLFIILIFYGTFNTWVNENHINKDSKIFSCPLVENLYYELHKISNTIMYQNEDFFNKINVDNPPEKTNYIGRAMSIYLQEYERRVLEVIYTYLFDNKVIVNNNAVLCFDGIMVLKEYWNESYLLELEQQILTETGFNLKLVVKEFDKSSYFLDIINPITYESMKPYINTFSTNFFKSLPTYSSKKDYFEYFFTKIIDDNLILQVYNINNETATYLHNLSTFASSFNHLRFKKYDIKTNKFIEKEFCKEWLVDESIRIAQKAEFIPINKTEDKMIHINKQNIGNYANIFTGYSNIINTPFARGKHINKWLTIMTELCEGNTTYRDYYIKCLASKIQNPIKKIPIGFILMGPQGVGKNITLNPIGSIIGDRHFISSSKVNDFFGEHGEGFCNKLIVNMNEVEGKDTLDLQGKLKEFITEDKLTVNMKFIRPIQVKNYALLILFTNKINPIQIDVKSSDRRWVVFKSTTKFVNKQVYGADFWNKVAEIFNSNEFKAELYDYLNTIDLSNFNPIKERPITESYKMLASLSIPKEVLFMEYLFEKRYEAYKENNPLLKDNKIIKESSKYYNEYEAIRLDKFINIKNNEKGQLFYNEFIEYCKSKNLLTNNIIPSNKKTYAEFINLDCGFKKVDNTYSHTVVIQFTFKEVFKNFANKNLSELLFKHCKINENDNTYNGFFD
jgi:hypothetical protein